MLTMTMRDRFIEKNLRTVMTSIVNRSLKETIPRSFEWAPMHLVTSERSFA